MSRNYINHGRRHRAGGSDPIPGFGIYPANPVRVQLVIPGNIADDSEHWSTVTIESRVRNNFVLESDGNTAAYIERKFTMGPLGSMWQLLIGYAEAPDAGILKASIATVPSPNPDREGDNDRGTLQPQTTGGVDHWDFVEIGTHDTYAASFVDASSIVGGSFRLMGGDQAMLTNFAGTDPFPPVPTGDGGAGQYAVRLEVDGKNDDSSGFVLRLNEAVFVRVDDNGFA